MKSLEPTATATLTVCSTSMKLQADTKRFERVFQEGDMVYLKLQPHVQSSVASRGNHKLAFKFFGPYKILQKVGTVAYKLDLQDLAQIHPVVHVSNSSGVFLPTLKLLKTFLWSALILHKNSTHYTYWTALWSPREQLQHSE